MKNHCLAVIALSAAFATIVGCADSAETGTSGEADPTAIPTTVSSAPAAGHPATNPYVDTVVRGTATVNGAARTAVLVCSRVFDPNNPTETTWHQCAGNVVAVKVALSAFDRDLGGSGDLSRPHSSTPACLAGADASLTAALLTYRAAVEDAENPQDPLDQRLAVVIGDLGYDRKGTALASGGIQPVNDATQTIVQSSCWKS